MIAKVVPFIRLPYSLSYKQKREISFFDYRIPKELEKEIKIGQLVEIYFKNKKVIGLIIGLKKTSKEKKLKEIERIIFKENLINKDQLKLLRWLSSFYLASFSTILKTSLPQPVKNKTRLKIHNHEKQHEIDLKISKKFLPDLKKMINIFTYSKRKKFLVFWQNPFEKIALYYFLIKKTLDKKQKILILLPEMDQIENLLKYLNKISNKISVLHSKLKKSEIWLNWQKILNNEIDIVIGTRMAIFAPIKNLGLIIVEDEESDLHHSKQFPYYDTRLIAWKLTKINKTKLIFSSQAPKTETYWYTFNQNKFLPLDLRKTKQTKLRIVDMKEEMRKGNFSPLSDDLKEAIIDNLKRKKRVILYLKRKGFATFNFCQDCGYLFSCFRCNLPLTAHKKNKIYYLLCHHCGYEQELPLKCPVCQGVEIKMKGLAIQKIEEILSSIGQVKSIENTTKDRSLDKEIIVTTLPFWQDYNKNWTENVGLVGMINADILLNHPDFRSSEKTFQEIVSIINWTNYFKIPLIIQTWSKDNTAIENAYLLNFKNFYQQELEIRREFFYPPFVRLFKLIIQEKNKEKLQKISCQFKKEFERIQNKNIKIFPLIIPPKRKKIFETNFLIKIKNSHPLSPLANEIKKILPLNSFLDPLS